MFSECTFGVSVLYNTASEENLPSDAVLVFAWSCQDLRDPRQISFHQRKRLRCSRYWTELNPLWCLRLPPRPNALHWSAKRALVHCNGRGKYYDSNALFNLVPCIRCSFGSLVRVLVGEALTSEPFSKPAHRSGSKEYNNLERFSDSTGTWQSRLKIMKDGALFIIFFKNMFSHHTSFEILIVQEWMNIFSDVELVYLWLVLVWISPPGMTVKRTHEPGVILLNG